MKGKPAEAAVIVAAPVEEIPVLEEEVPPTPVDFKAEPPVDPEGRVILEVTTRLMGKISSLIVSPFEQKAVVVELSFVTGIVERLRQKLFGYVEKIQGDAFEEANSNDKDFVSKLATSDVSVNCFSFLR